MSTFRSLKHRLIFWLFYKIAASDLLSKLTELKNWLILGLIESLGMFQIGLQSLILLPTPKIV